MSTTSARLLYRTLLFVLAPPLVAYTAWQALRARSLRYLAERAGLFRSRPGIDLWLHAASVGEVNAALPLLKRLAKGGDRRLLVTTTTPSGARTLREKVPSAAHAYLPLDWPGAVGRFLDAFRPRAGLVVETELWPELFRACSRRGIPLVIVNGRLSPRTLGAAPWLRRLYGEALASAAAVLARSDEDRERFIGLGAGPERCRTAGNLKFAVRHAAVSPLAVGRPYVVAASTREGEEARLLRAWRGARNGGRLLVVVPRHPQRLPAILGDLAPLNTRVAVRSRGEPITGETEVYLADTFGELPGMMAGADLVVMGGSFADKGGQNLLEPAALARCIVAGPHMENFRAEVELMLAEGAVRQVDSDAALTAAFDELLPDEPARSAMGARAKAVMERHADVVERYLAELCEYLPDVLGNGTCRRGAEAPEDPGTPAAETRRRGE